MWLTQLLSNIPKCPKAVSYAFGIMFPKNLLFLFYLVLVIGSQFIPGFWIIFLVPADVWVEHRQTHDIQGCANASRSNDQKQRDQLQQKMLPMTYCNATKLHYCITFLVTTMTNKRTSSNVLSRYLWPSKTLTQAPCVLGLERSVTGVWRGCGLRNRITDSNKDRERLLLPLQPPVHRSSTFLRTQYLPLHNSPRHVHPPVVTYEKGSEG